MQHSIFEGVRHILRTIVPGLGNGRQ